MVVSGFITSFSKCNENNRQSDIFNVAGDEEQRVAGGGSSNNALARALLELVFQIIISRHCVLRLVVSWTREQMDGKSGEGENASRMRYKLRKRGQQARFKIQMRINA